MKKTIILIVLTGFLLSVCMAEEIVVGNKYSYFEYDEIVIWNNTAVACKILEIYPQNSKIAKLVIDVPFNKAGAFNAIVLYVEVGKKIYCSSQNEVDQLLGLSVATAKENTIFSIKSFEANRIIYAIEKQ